jgi:hypothetical protein
MLILSGSKETESITCLLEGPNYMYKYPPLGTRKYATPATEELLQQKIEEVSSYSPDEYLPQVTRELCDSLLAERGYSTPVFIEFQSTNQLHREIYYRLRDDLTLWQQLNGPISTIQPPLGAHNWIQRNQDIELHRRQDQEMDLGPTDDEEEEEEPGCRSVSDHEDEEEDQDEDEGDGLLLNI